MLVRAIGAGSTCATNSRLDSGASGFDAPARSCLPLLESSGRSPVMCDAILVELSGNASRYRQGCPGNDGHGALLRADCRAALLDSRSCRRDMETMTLTTKVTDWIMSAATPGKMTVDEALTLDANGASYVMSVNEPAKARR